MTTLKNKESTEKTSSNTISYSPPNGRIIKLLNYLHENQKGSHIHVYKKDMVKRGDLGFHEAEKVIKELSKRILRERFNEIVRFGDD